MTGPTSLRPAALALLLAGLAAWSVTAQPGGRPVLPPDELPAPVGRPGFTVVPAGPVSDQTNVELRLAVPNRTDRPAAFAVSFFWDRVAEDNLIRKQAVQVPPGGVALARAWAPTARLAGERKLLYRIEGPGGIVQGDWPLTVVASRTPALPILSAGWLDPLAVGRGIYGRERDMAPADVAAVVDMAKRLGMTTLVVTYVEYQGSWYYPSRVRFHDPEARKEVAEQRFNFDIVGTILERAEENGMHVLLGLGRSGDTNLLWEFDKPGWQERNRRAVGISQQVAEDLWAKYGHRRSLYGWYLTHEMNDLEKASAYYDPVAEHCHSLAPEKPVMVAPAGTPKITRDVLERSKVDIFAYQDAVGVGYVPYQNTYDPKRRLAQLDEVFVWYRRLHNNSGKHLWADLELWERAGPPDRHPTYAAPFGRVKQQIDIEARHVDVLTGYELFGFLEPPRVGAPLPDPRAGRLFEDYARYVGAGR